MGKTGAARSLFAPSWPSDDTPWHSIRVELLQLPLAKSLRVQGAYSKWQQGSRAIGDLEQHRCARPHSCVTFGTRRNFLVARASFAPWVAKAVHLAWHCSQSPPATCSKGSNGSRTGAYSLRPWGARAGLPPSAGTGEAVAETIVNRRKESGHDKHFAPPQRGNRKGLFRSSKSLRAAVF